jgi:hypothetical protein
MRELQALNRELPKNDRLHILPTIRLRPKGKKHTLIITKYKKADTRKLSKRERQQLEEQKKREESILLRHGYGFLDDVWVVVEKQVKTKNGKTITKPVAYIADFGNITKSKF